MAAEKARLEEEAREWERALEEEARKQEEERREQEEEECLVVEQGLREVGGPSRERAPWRWLFLPSLDSAGSLEEEEGMPGPSRDKGKGRGAGLGGGPRGSHRGHLRPL